MNDAQNITKGHLGRQEAAFLAQKTGVSLLRVPHDVGSSPEAKDWFSLMDRILSLLK